MGKEGLQSRIMAMAMRIMRTWWYPSNGISPVGGLSVSGSGTF